MGCPVPPGCPRCAQPPLGMGQGLIPLRQLVKGKVLNLFGQARRRRGVERRGKRSQEIQERLRFRQEEERWQGTEAILHTIELLHNRQEVSNPFLPFPCLLCSPGGEKHLECSSRTRRVST